MKEYNFRENISTPYSIVEVQTVNPLEKLENLDGQSIAEARYEYYINKGWLVPQPHQVDALNNMIQDEGRVDRARLPEASPRDYNEYLDGYSGNKPYNITGLVSVKGKPLFTARVGNEKHNLLQKEGNFYTFDPVRKKLENFGAMPEGRFVQENLPPEFLDFTRYVPLSANDKETNRLHQMIGESLFLAHLPQFIDSIPQYGIIMESSKKSLAEYYMNYGAFIDLFFFLPTLSIGSSGELKQESVTVILFENERYIDYQSSRVRNLTDLMEKI